ncbi:hypothetical protein [Streptosporangium roseum]|uniref:hypothetical protein n=1 Tax=Streptosporangium roseum TaxID=2001 RepID=UPI0012DE3E32|nr:hypothetical protein [Streptosporangium roseum]
MRDRRMRAQNVPLQLVTSYIPRFIADGTLIAELDSGMGGISSRLADLGYTQAEIEEIDHSSASTWANSTRMYLGWVGSGRGAGLAISPFP